MADILTPTLGESVTEATIAKWSKKVGDAALDAFMAQRKESVREVLEKSLRYSPVMRFVLADADARLFDVERMTYSGDGGWQGLTWPPLPLKKAVKEYLRHLGKESFFELM